MNEPEVLASPAGRWQEAKVFSEVNWRDISSSQPKMVGVVGELVLWFKGISLYHQAELGGVPTKQDRQMQKNILSSLISMGEWLVSELRERDITAKAGVTLADVEATLEELYDNLRVSFGGMTEARRTQVIDEVFDAS